MTKKALRRNTTLQGSRWLNVDEIGGCGNSLSPKVRWERGGNHHSTSRLKEMTMFAFRNTVLSMGTRARELGESALFRKKATQHVGYILTSRISTQDTNRHGKLGVNHGSKALVDRENLTASFHKIEPSVAREIINNENII